MQRTLLPLYNSRTTQPRKS